MVTLVRFYSVGGMGDTVLTSSACVYMEDVRSHNNHA